MKFRRAEHAADRGDHTRQWAAVERRHRGQCPFISQRTRAAAFDLLLRPVTPVAATYAVTSPSWTFIGPFGEASIRLVGRW